MPEIHARSRLKKWCAECGKVVALAVCFVLIQHQIIALHSELADAHGCIATALGDHHGEISHAREELRGVVESSEKKIEEVKSDLERSQATIENERDSLTNLLQSREKLLFDSIDVEFARYKGELERAINASRENQARLQSVEELVGQVVGRDSDPNWMEKAIIYPIVQLKGEGTVGSGVLVYSRRGAARSEDGEAGARATSFVLTACHVVMEVLGRGFPAGVVKGLRVTDPERPGEMKEYEGTVEIYDESRDLALLRLVTDAPFEHVARVLDPERAASLRLFSRVYAVGCPLGNNPLPSCGEISSREKVVGDQRFWMVNAPTFFGNSGGGVFVAETCELIGISSMIYTYGKSRPVVVPHMGLFVPIDMVSTWLDSEGYEFVLSGAPEAMRATASVPSASAKADED